MRPLLKFKSEEVKKLRDDFKQFIESYGVISVAVGIVMGQAIAKVINVIVEGLVMPVLGLVLPGEKWQEAVFHLGRAEIKIGLIIAAIIDFCAVAAVVYLVVRYILKLGLGDDKKG